MWIGVGVTVEVGVEVEVEVKGGIGVGVCVGWGKIMAWELRLEFEVCIQIPSTHYLSYEEYLLMADIIQLDNRWVGKH